MDKWRMVGSVVLGLLNAVSIVEAITWAIGNRGVVKIAGLEFDERVIVDVYVWLAFLSLAAAIVLLAPLLVPLLERKLRPKSHKFGDLLGELRQVREGLRYFPTENADQGESYERLQRIHRKLVMLEVPAPSVDDHRLEAWEEYLARLSVLAEQRQYKEAKALWGEM